jgi:hypothetical protein
VSDNFRRIFTTGIWLVIFVGILFFGLRPKDLTLTNNIQWLTSQNGIQLSPYGIAYSPPFIASAPSGNRQETELTIELAVQTDSNPSRQFSFVLAFDNGKDSAQLLLGQWRSWLILMNGDDYAHKKKRRRLSVNTAKLPDGVLFLTITTGSNGTYLHCNGKLAAAEEDLTLTIPSGDKSRLLLGSSAYGTQSWRGKIYGLAIYPKVLDVNTIDVHYRSWTRQRDFRFALRDDPLALYAFDEKKGEKVRDDAGSADLEIPRSFRGLRRQVLALPWKNFEYNKGFLVDALLNLVAFVPFGFFTVATLRQLGGGLKANAFLLAVLLGVLTSLLIEISQSWLPSRSSTLLDLTLNSLGSLAGVAACGFFADIRRRSLF